uniref:Apolipoprotein M n=1 Tax=Sander lucioperca TaxID=283035 RepID=A0A8D0AQM8_SANLU
MFAVCAITLLFLMSLSHSAPLDCKDLVQPLAQADPRHYEGRWAMIASSLKIIKPERPVVPFSVPYADSLRIDFYNSTYTQADRNGDRNLTGNFVHTSCQDCLLMRLNVESGKRQHFYLFSRRRQLEQKEMEEFRAQVKCLNMPSPAVMDPTKELCPQETAGDPAAN